MDDTVEANLPESVDRVFRHILDQSRCNNKYVNSEQEYFIGITPFFAHFNRQTNVVGEIEEMCAHTALPEIRFIQ